MRPLVENATTLEGKIDLTSQLLVSGNKESFQLKSSLAHLQSSVRQMSEVLQNNASKMEIVNSKIENQVSLLSKTEDQEDKHSESVEDGLKRIGSCLVSEAKVEASLKLSVKNLSQLITEIEGKLLQAAGLKAELSNELDSASKLMVAGCLKLEEMSTTETGIIKSIPSIKGWITNERNVFQAVEKLVDSSEASLKEISSRLEELLSLVGDDKERVERLKSLQSVFQGMNEVKAKIESNLIKLRVQEKSMERVGSKSSLEFQVGPERARSDRGGHQAASEGRSCGSRQLEATRRQQEKNR
jgi:chromosome segregation ATPase